MEQQDPMRGRLLAAALVVLVLNLTGVILLGFSQEMLRSQVANLAQTVRDAPAPTPAPTPPDPSRELAALRDALAKLTTKVDVLAASDDCKAIGRLILEIKSLASRVDALAAARTAPARSTPAKSTPAKSGNTRSQTLQPPPRPYYGPDYPAYPSWPGY